MATVTIRWKRQPRQLKFLRACGLSHAIEGGEPRKPVAKIIGYGGAAGGGKTDALLVAAIIYCLTYPGASVGYFRRTFTQLEGPGGAILRSHQLLKGIARWNGSLHRWTFPNGSILQFCYCEKDNDVYNYQSQQFDVIMFDEATQFSWFQVSYLIFSRMRSAKGYPTFAGMATNPGGVGHAWFKRCFIDVGEWEVPHQIEMEPGKRRSVIFIQSKVTDNQVLMDNDPDYIRNLDALPEHLRRQLKDGDWDVAEGIAFPEWRRDIHVCDPFPIPDSWIRFRSMDWGYSKPYCIGWYAVDFDGTMYKYRELYGWGGRENVGSREDPEDVAKKIINLEKGEKIHYAVADSAIFGGRQDNYPTVAEQFATAFGNEAVHWSPITKGPESRRAGKIEVHHRLKWSEEDPFPKLIIFSNCKHTIRTIPNLVLDEKNPEDVDSELEDHAYDETRYACMSRPITPKPKEKPKTRIQKHKQKLIKAREAIHIRVVV